VKRKIPAPAVNRTLESDRPAHSLVAIPTELSRLLILGRLFQIGVKADVILDEEVGSQ
jgi:hypothetical protein